MISLFESMAFSAASAFANGRRPARRQAPGRIIRAVSRESADRVVDALAAERRRSEELSRQLADMHVQCAAQARELRAARIYVSRLSA